MEATQMENVDKQLDIAFALTSALHVKDVIKAFQNFESFFNILAFTIEVLNIIEHEKVTILPSLKHSSSRDKIRYVI